MNLMNLKCFLKLAGYYRKSTENFSYTRSKTLKELLEDDEVVT